MPDHQPGPTEDLLHLVVVDRLLAEDAAVELAGGGVDDGVFPSGAHTRISSRGHDSIPGESSGRIRREKRQRCGIRGAPQRTRLTYRFMIGSLKRTPARVLRLNPVGAQNTRSGEALPRMLSEDDEPSGNPSQAEGE